MSQVMQQPAGWMQAFVLHNLAERLWETGDLTAAKQMAQASLQLFDSSGRQLLSARSAVAVGAALRATKGITPRPRPSSTLALEQYEAAQRRRPHGFGAAVAGGVGLEHGAARRGRRAVRARGCSAPQRQAPAQPPRAGPLYGSVAIFPGIAEAAGAAGGWRGNERRVHLAVWPGVHPPLPSASTPGQQIDSALRCEYNYGQGSPTADVASNGRRAVMTGRPKHLVKGCTP